jgi:hypothetical protein
LPLASEAEVSEHHYAAKLANQFFYAKASESGKFFGYAGVGYAGSADGFNTIVNFKEAAMPLYVVPPNRRRVKVWYVQEGGAEETLRAEGASSNLQSYWEAVPLPDVNKLPHGQIPTVGTDHTAFIWSPATDELWQFFRLYQFLEGPHQGEWKSSYGSYISPVSGSNGINPNKWGPSASCLSNLGGTISTRDLVNVLRGGKIGHALSVVAIVTADTPLAPLPPATSNDTRENLSEAQKPKAENPAYGAVDAVPEGLWCRFPPASRASEFGMSGEPLATAIYEAIREHGLVVRDGGPNMAFIINDPRTLGTPYSDTPVNPFAGAVSLHGGNTAAQIEEYVNAFVPSGWTDPTLPVLSEELHGTSSVLSKMPWRTLEQLKPRSG